MYRSCRHRFNRPADHQRYRRGLDIRVVRPICPDLYPLLLCVDYLRTEMENEGMGG